jgi:hypothetical protein
MRKKMIAAIGIVMTGTIVVTEIETTGAMIVATGTETIMTTGVATRTIARRIVVGVETMTMMMSMTMVHSTSATMRTPRAAAVTKSPPAATGTATRMKKRRTRTGDDGINTKSPTSLVGTIMTMRRMTIGPTIRRAKRSAKIGIDQGRNQRSVTTRIGEGRGSGKRRSRGVTMSRRRRRERCRSPTGGSGTARGRHARAAHRAAVGTTTDTTTAKQSATISFRACVCGNK